MARMIDNIVNKSIGSNYYSSGMNNYGKNNPLLPNNNKSSQMGPPRPTGGNQGQKQGGFFQGLGDMLGGVFGEEGFLGPEGWGNTALDSLTGLGGAYLGMRQYGLAKRMFGENMRQFNLNYNAGVTDYNRQINDQYSARRAGMSSEQRQQAASLAEYMSQWGLQPSGGGG